MRYAGWQPPEWSGFIELPIPTPPSLPLGRTNGYSRGWQHRVTKPIHASCWSPSTLAVGPNCSRPLIPVVKRCSIHKLVRLQAELSQPSLQTPSSRIRPTCSAFCCSVVSVSRFRCQSVPVTADAIALSLRLAIIAQHVLPRGHCEAEQGLWKGELPEYTEKQGGQPRPRVRPQCRYHQPVGQPADRGYCVWAPLT